MGYFQVTLMATFYGSSKERASKRAASKASRAVADKKVAAAKAQARKSSSGSSSSSRNQAMTRTTESGGTYTITTTGIVTERDSKGNLISRYNADPKEAGSYVRTQITKDRRAREAGDPYMYEPTYLKDVQRRANQNTKNFAEETMSKVPSTNPNLNNNNNSKNYTPFNPFEDTFQKTKVVEKNLPQDKAKETRTAYQRADKRVLGLLPGGLTMNEAITETTTEPLGTSNFFQKGVIAANPLLYTYTDNVRKKASDVVKRGSDFVARNLPNPLGLKVEGASGDNFVSMQEQKYNIALQMNKEGKLDNYGFLRTANPFKNPWNKKDALGSDIILAVKEGKTFEEYKYGKDIPSIPLILPSGATISPVKIQAGGLDLVREKPVEIAQAGAELYVSSRLLATAGLKASKFLHGYTSTAAANSGKLFNAGRFLVVDMPLVAAQSELIGYQADRISKDKNFDPTTTKVFNLGSRVLHGEALGELYGGIGQARMGYIDKSLGWKSWVPKAFVQKAAGGAAEATAGYATITSNNPDMKISPLGLVDIGIGRQSVLPSKSVIVTPAIDTLSDKRFKTDNITMNETDYAAYEKSMKGKVYSEINPDTFKNTNITITNKDGQIIGTSVYSFQKPETKKNQYNVGSILSSTIFAGAGVLSAGSFGVLEVATSKAPGVSTVLGYGSDLPEAPGDFAYDLGYFKPFGKIDAGAKVKTINNVFSYTGTKTDVDNFGKYGGTATNFKTTFKGTDVKGNAFEFQKVYQNIKANAPTKAPQFNKVNDIFTGTKDVTKSKSKSKSVSNTLNIINTPSNTNTITFLKNDITTPTPQKDYLPTGVFTEVPTNVGSFDITDTKTTDNVNEMLDTNVNIRSNTNNNVLSVTNVMTPKFIFPWIPPGGGGDSFFKGSRGTKRSYSYLPSIASQEKLFRDIFKKQSVTKKSGFNTGLNLRL